EDSSQPKQRRDQWCQLHRECLARREVASPRIEMSERDPPAEGFAGALQRIAHVAKEEKLGGRYAVRVRGNPPLADIDSSIRKALTQVIVRPAVTQPEF